MKYLGAPIGGVCVKSPETADAAALIDLMKQILDETPFLTARSDEFNLSVEDEATFIRNLENDERGCLICAWLDGRLVGSASLSAAARNLRLRHRAKIGICVRKDAWGCGVGSRLMDALIQAAQSAGFRQLELEVMEDNARAIRLYRKFGFEEWGRLPGGVRRDGEDCALIGMVRSLVEAPEGEKR